MDKPRVFITGATGFVGATMVRYFAGQEWSVTANGRVNPPTALHACARYVQSDIRQPIPEQQSDVVVHAAALASDAASFSDLHTANLVGTRHVFEATRSSRTFIYISSSSVYDLKNNHVHVEDEKIDQSRLSPYGQTKRAGENWLLEQDWSKRTLIILRPRAIYGPGDRILLPRLLRLVRRNHIVIPGDMRVRSSMTHVDNLCQAAGHCLEHFENTPGGAHIFNLTDTEPYEMRTVVRRLLSDLLGRNLAFTHLPLAPLWFMAGMAERMRIPTSFTRMALSAVCRDNVLDIIKIRSTTGFEPKINLWESMHSIVAWAKTVGLNRVRAAANDLSWSGIETL